jgi:ribulose-5-phosphate 4-epimerase/fuculose-1-phosphate aldolase
VSSSLEELRVKVATACRILAKAGLVKEFTGHVSLRLPGTDEMLIRCRGDNEDGVLFTEPAAIRRVSFDGKGPDLEGRFATPIELPIHGEIYKARPEVNCVVHAHPTGALLCGIAGLAFQPLFGAYDPDAMQLALDGVPVYERSTLVTDPEDAHELIAAMDGHSVCLMRGHGITVAAPTIELAVVKAIKLESLARITLKAAGLGPGVRPISAEDIAAFARMPRQSVHFQRSAQWIWDHYVRLIAEDGPIPADLSLQ